MATKPRKSISRKAKKLDAKGLKNLSVKDLKVRAGGQDVKGGRNYSKIAIEYK